MEKFEHHGSATHSITSSARASTVARTSRRIKPHIGGVMPSRPTEMAAASSVPSSFLLAAEMKILAPGLSLDREAYLAYVREQG
jgi:hypothetical protein